MFSLFKVQLGYLLRKKSTIAVFFILIGFVVAEYIMNLSEAIKIGETTMMNDPFMVSALSDWSKVGYYLFAFYPFLVVFPTATAFVNDRSSRIKLYYEGRSNKRDYYYSKLLAIACTTFIVFTVPFILELVLNIVSFDVQNSRCHPSGLPYVDSAKTYTFLLDGLYYEHRVLYVLLMILIFGLASAIFAVFNAAITVFPLFEYKIFTYFPIYLLLYLLRVVEGARKGQVLFNYITMLRWFDGTEKLFPAFLILLFVLGYAAFVIVRKKIGKDDVL